ncbi:MAG: ROK family protein [Oscillospiraceae bacterium]|nr:ROK family protein [Oscillospiraceae bacterium]
MKYYIGIDLGGTNIATGVFNENYNTVKLHSRPTLASRGFGPIVADMADAAKTVIAEAGLTLDDFSSVGIGVPSGIDPKTHRVLYSNNLNWRDVPLIEEFNKYIDKPVYLANDADSAAFGEYLAGVGKEFGSILMMTLGTGVGGGLIIDGNIFLGGDHSCFELGHVTLVLDGVRCTCGRLGCIEAYASITGLIRETIEAIAASPGTLMREICGNDFRKVSGRTAFEAAKKGDEAAQAVVNKYAYYVASTISSLDAVFRPNAVLIGGGVSNEGEYLIDPVRRMVAETIYGKGILKSPEILKASLGNLAGIIGAAFLEAQGHEHTID